MLERLSKLLKREPHSELVFERQITTVVDLQPELDRLVVMRPDLKAIVEEFRETGNLTKEALLVYLHGGYDAQRKLLSPERWLERYAEISKLASCEFPMGPPQAKKEKELFLRSPLERALGHEIHW